MLHRNTKLPQDGFTIAELTVVIVITSISAIVLYTLFNTSFLNYLGLQKESTSFNNVAQQSQRIATVVRSLTDIEAASSSDITFYAYFSPNDTYVSHVRYYVSGTKPSLLAEVTPMDGNPPSGNLLTAKQRDYTVIDDLGQTPTNLFEYLDSAGTKLTVPIADLHTIKGITVNLSQDLGGSTAGNIYRSSLTVSLRNRKTNL